MKFVILFLFALTLGKTSAFRRILPSGRFHPRSSCRVMCESGAGSSNLGEVSEKVDIPAERAQEFNGIRQYKEIFGNLQVPSDYVVPTADFSWPEETWGMPLGKIVDTIKNTDEYDIYKEELEKIGFRYSAPKPPQQTMEEAKKDFDLGNIITIGLYSWIAYLAFDTARIVFFSGPPPSPTS